MFMFIYIYDSLYTWWAVPIEIKSTEVASDQLLLWLLKSKILVTNKLSRLAYPIQAKTHTHTHNSRQISNQMIKKTKNAINVLRILYNQKMKRDNNDDNECSINIYNECLCAFQTVSNKLSARE